MTTLTIPTPDDWHLHLRDGDLLADTVPHTARQFARAIVMPNLTPPVTTVAKARAYRDRILAAVPAGQHFEPLMTLYLTDRTEPDTIHEAAECGFIQGCKLYPAGATTNSDAGVTKLAHIHPALAAMQDAGLVLQVHGEVTDPGIDIFAREAAFIEQRLKPIAARFPHLRIVLEHITTSEAVDFVREAGPNIAATITPQHIRYNRNAMFEGGIRPHRWCLPVLKAERHRHAVAQAAFSGDPSFFLGTDSAPHTRSAKESACGCAGIFSAPHALELYAESFAQAGALSRLADFASRFGADFYGLPHNPGEITLEQSPCEVPADLPLAGQRIVPMLAGETVSWTYRGTNT